MCSPYLVKYCFLTSRIFSVGVVQQTPNISKIPQCALRTVVMMGKIVEGHRSSSKDFLQELPCRGAGCQRSGQVSTCINRKGEWRGHSRLRKWAMIQRKGRPWDLPRACLPILVTCYSWIGHLELCTELTGTSDPTTVVCLVNNYEYLLFAEHH